VGVERRCRATRRARLTPFWKVRVQEPMPAVKPWPASLPLGCICSRNPWNRSVARLRGDSGDDAERHGSPKNSRRRDLLAQPWGRAGIDLGAARVPVRGGPLGQIGKPWLWLTLWALPQACPFRRVRGFVVGRIQSRPVSRLSADARLSLGVLSRQSRINGYRPLDASTCVLRGCAAIFRQVSWIGSWADVGGRAASLLLWGGAEPCAAPSGQWTRAESDHLKDFGSLWPA